MINAPRMLMLGSAGRNFGRTDFVCSLIDKFHDMQQVVAVNVTVVKDADGKSSLDCKDCGVCIDVTDNYIITQEFDKGRGKDTERMVLAGASRVFWLQVAQEQYLHEGMTALLEHIGKDCFVVCESNSLRAVVNPGVFLIFSQDGDRPGNGLAEAVGSQADRFVTYSQAGFDLDMDDIDIQPDGWALRADATAIILAGGMSQRMKRDKSMLPIEGIPMVEHVHRQLGSHFKQILVSANDVEKYIFLGSRVVPDSIAGQGPLMGIASALQASEYELNFVTACDMPEVNVALVRRMLREANGFDAVIPIAEGRMEPLFAVYRKSVVDVFQHALAQGKRRIRDAFDECSIRYLDITAAEPLKNLNTREDYAAFISRVTGEPEERSPPGDGIIPD